MGMIIFMMFAGLGSAVYLRWWDSHIGSGISFISNLNFRAFSME